MVAKPTHIEAQWEDVLRHSEQFAGKRVRVTVLSDDASQTYSMHNEVRRWLAEGDALQISPRSDSCPNAFGDSLVEKFRKQGLVF